MVLSEAAEVLRRYKVGSDSEEKLEEAAFVCDAVRNAYLGEDQ